MRERPSGTFTLRDEFRSAMKISIAMASYNGERFLQEQLESFARQTLQPYELVVTDDGSTDRTPELIADFARRVSFPVRFYRNQQRLGHVSNFLQAASLCTGDLIAFSDQDDVWLSHKLSRCAECFKDEEVLVAIHSGKVVDENLNPTGWLFPEIDRDAVVPPLTPAPGRSFSGFAMVFRPSLPLVFDSRKPWTGETLGEPVIYDHDQWLYFLSNIFGRTALIREALVLYRRHSATVTSPARLSSAKQSRIALNTGADTYMEKAQLAARRADYLEQSAGFLPDEQRQRARKGAQHYRHAAQTFELRSRLYRNESSW